MHDPYDWSPCFRLLALSPRSVLYTVDRIIKNISGTSLVKTPCLHCRGPGFLGQGNKIPHAVGHSRKKKNEMASVLCSEPSHDHLSLRVEIPTRSISSLSGPTSCHSLTSSHSPVPLCRKVLREGCPAGPSVSSSSAQLSPCLK